VLNKGATVSEVARSFGITETTWYRWKNTYGAMLATDAKRLKELEAENRRLKKIVADQALDIDMLKEIASGNF
jgi:transposase-like protein